MSDNASDYIDQMWCSVGCGVDALYMEQMLPGQKHIHDAIEDITRISMPTHTELLEIIKQHGGEVVFERPCEGAERHAYFIRQSHFGGEGFMPKYLQDFEHFADTARHQIAIMRLCMAFYEQHHDPDMLRFIVEGYYQQSDITKNARQFLRENLMHVMQGKEESLIRMIYEMLARMADDQGYRSLPHFWRLLTGFCCLVNCMTLFKTFLEQNGRSQMICGDGRDESQTAYEEIKWRAMKQFLQRNRGASPEAMEHFVRQLYATICGFDSKRHLHIREVIEKSSGTVVCILGCGHFCNGDWDDRMPRDPPFIEDDLLGCNAGVTVIDIPSFHALHRKSTDVMVDVRNRRNPMNPLDILYNFYDRCKKEASKKYGVVSSEVV